MKNIIAGQHALTNEEFAELALGEVLTDLFAGPAEGESEMGRAARLAAANDILADLRREDPELADYAGRLLRGDSIIAHWPPLALPQIGGAPCSGKAAHRALLGQVAA